MICLIFILAISTVSASDIVADDILAGDGDTFTDLQNEIDNHDSLTLNQNYTFNNLTDNNINVSKSMIIDGNNCVLDGNQESDIFVINSSEITLKNIVFKNYNGTALYFNNTDNAVIENCRFINGNPFFESSIYFNGGNLTLIGCEFFNISTIHMDYYFIESNLIYSNINSWGNAFLYVNSSENVVVSKVKISNSTFGNYGFHIKNAENVTFDSIESSSNLGIEYRLSWDYTSNLAYIYEIIHAEYSSIFYANASNIQFSNSIFKNDDVDDCCYFQTNNLTIKNINVTNSSFWSVFDVYLYAEVPNLTYTQPEAHMVFEDVNVIDCNRCVKGYDWNPDINNYTYFIDYGGGFILNINMISYINPVTYATYFPNATVNLRNIQFINDSFKSGIYFYRGNLTIENIYVYNFINNETYIQYDSRNQQYYKEYGWDSSFVINADVDNFKLNNLTVNDTCGGVYTGIIIQLNKANNVSITNVTLYNISSGDYGSIVIQDAYYRNNCTGDIILENITFHELNSFMNGTSYHYSDGTYSWAAFDEFGGCIFVESSDSNVRASNIVADSISLGIFSEGAFCFIGNNVEVNNISMFNSNLSGEVGGLDIHAKATINLSDVCFDDVCVADGFEEEYSTYSGYSCTIEGMANCPLISLETEGDVKIKNINITNALAKFSDRVLFSINAENVSIEKVILENITSHDDVDSRVSENPNNFYYSSYTAVGESVIEIAHSWENYVAPNIFIKDISANNIFCPIQDSFMSLYGDGIHLEDINITNAWSGGEVALHIQQDSNKTVTVNNVYMNNVTRSPGENETEYDSSSGKYVWQYSGLENGGAGIGVQASDCDAFLSNITIINSDGGGYDGLIYSHVNNTYLSDVYIENISSPYSQSINYNRDWDTYLKESHAYYNPGAKIGIDSNIVAVNNVSIFNSVGGGQNGKCEVLIVQGVNITVNDVNIKNISRKEYFTSYFDKSYNVYINYTYLEPTNVVLISPLHDVNNAAINLINFSVDNVPASTRTIQFTAQNVTITNSSFKNMESIEVLEEFDYDLHKYVLSKSDNSGNGVIIQGENALIFNTIFSDIALGGRKSYDEGLALLSYADNSLFDNSSFINCAGKSYNYTYHNGGNYYETDFEESYGSAVQLYGWNNNINNTKFINCSSDNGGALYLIEKVNIDNSQFINCSAKYGGAIYVDSSVFLINNTNFTENEAVDGGAVYFNITAYDNAIHNSSFVKNRAFHNGGAIYIIASNQNGENVIDQSTFDHNHADYVGGAFYFDDTQNRELFIDYEFLNRTTLYSDGPQEFVGYYTKILNSLYELNTDYALAIDANDTVYGKNSTVIIRIADDAYGNVFVNITDEEGNILNDVEGNPINGEYLLKEGMVEFQLGVLPVGKYNVTAHYDDYEYNEPGDEYVYHINSTLFNVYPHFLNVSSNSTIYTDQNITVIAKLNNLTNGEIRFKFNETFEYMMNVTNGTAIANIAGFYSGTYTVNVTYLGDKVFYEISNSTDFTVLSRDSLVNVTAQNITYGENAIIVVRVPTSQKGNVTVIVDKEYTKEISDGEVSFEISDLNADKYPVSVVFNENRIYKSNNNETVFWVNKAKLDVKASAQNITVLENPEFIIDIDDFNGKVKIEIDGETYYDDNVFPIIQTDKLLAGNKTAKLTFYGDDNYNETTLDVNFTVSRISIDINATIRDAVYPNDAKAIVQLSGSGNGTIKITTADGVETSLIENGYANIDLKGLSAGIKDAIVEFISEDGYYENASTAAKFIVERGNTTLTVAVDDNEDIVVKLKDDVTGNVTVVVNDEEHSATIENGRAVLRDIKFNEGNNTIVAIYENENYNLAYNKTTYLVSVSEKIDSDLAITVDDDVITVDVGDNATGNVSVYVNGEEFSVPVVGGKAILDGVVFNEGSNSIVAFYAGDDTYNAGSNSTVYEVPVPEKANPILTIAVDDDVITVDVGDNATGNVSVYVNGDEFSVPVVGGKAVLDGVVFNEGGNSIVAFYAGDDTYNAGSNSTIYEVPVPQKVNPSLAIDVEDDVVTVSINGDATGNMIIIVNSKDSVIPIKDGKAVLSGVEFNEGNNTIVAFYGGDDKYNPAHNTTVHEVPAPETKNKTDILMGIDVKDDSIIITVPENATGDIVVSVNGKKSSVPIKDGKATLDNVDLLEGENTIIAVYGGDENYNGADVIFTFNKTGNETPVVKNKTDVDVAITVEDGTVTVDVAENATGNVTLYVNGEKSILPINDGKAVLDDAPLIYGNNTIIAIYEGDDNYNGGYSDKTVEIKDDKSVIISTGDVIKYFSGPERFNVTVAYNNGTPVYGVEVKIRINGRQYTRVTDENGVASLALNLNSGNYTAEVEVSEYNYTSKNIVKVLATIYATDVIKVFRNGTQYYGLFLDGEGNPLVNTEVSFNINGVFYKRTTNASGWARLNLNLEKGTYILTAINPATSEMRTNIVTVISQLQTSDLTKYYRNDSQFVVRVRADDGSWAGAGEVVSFNVHGRLYNRTTNATGHAVLNINLEPEEYIITSYYKECREGNTIEVLPVLTANDLSMKYKDGSQFKAKLIDGQGKLYAGQKITFNINGVFYSRTTGSDGVAKLNINLQSGQYIITSEYNEYKISNIIKIGA